MFELRAQFAVGAEDGLGALHVFAVSPTELTDQQERLFDELSPRATTGIGIQISNGRQSAPSSRIILPISDEGAFSLDEISRYGRVRVSNWKSYRISQFISQESLDRNSMSEMWDEIVLDGREQDVVKAMRILEPKLSSIFFLSGERTFGFEGRGGILVGFERMQRLPLGSLGEGMRRMLALALGLAKSQGGILLIDEIDTGLQLDHG